MYGRFLVNWGRGYFAYSATVVMPSSTLLRSGSVPVGPTKKNRQQKKTEKRAKEREKKQT